MSHTTIDHEKLHQAVSLYQVLASSNMQGAPKATRDKLTEIVDTLLDQSVTRCAALLTLVPAGAGNDEQA